MTVNEQFAAVRNALAHTYDEDALATLDSLEEQLETVCEERDLFYDRLQESREQLEAAHKVIDAAALELSRYGRITDEAAGHELLVYADSIPASSPVTNDRAGDSS